MAILRGLKPAEAPAIGEALTGAGFGLLEVPLNSPQPLVSIALLAKNHPTALVGAGTVLTAEQVRAVHAAGGQLIVSPNFNTEVVKEAVKLGMICLPGIATPTEAFGALASRCTWAQTVSGRNGVSCGRQSHESGVACTHPDAARRGHHTRQHGRLAVRRVLTASASAPRFTSPAKVPLPCGKMLCFS